MSARLPARAKGTSPPAYLNQQAPATGHAALRGVCDVCELERAVCDILLRKRRVTFVNKKVTCTV